MSPDELARHARQHVESLRRAGVEWLPDGPAPDVRREAPTTSLPVLSAAGSVQGGLFGSDAPAAGEARLTDEQRRQALDALRRQVAQCVRCPALASTRTQTVFGVGPLDAELCFLGEAPGADEDRLGEPFVGAAGQLLNRIIAACGLKREDVYICNILRCRPPGNRLPQAEEAANCREYLDGTLALVRPKYICCLGACAAQNLLGTTQSVGKLRGRFLDHNGVTVMVTYHPAYLLRAPEQKRAVWDDMKKLLARMGKPIPGGK